MGGAGLLILVGLVFQLGALGYGHVQPDNVWVASTIVESGWSMVVAQLDAQGVQDFTKFWPLLLISMGLAILLVKRRGGDQRLLSTSRGGQDHGE